MAPKGTLRRSKVLVFMWAPSLAIWQNFKACNDRAEDNFLKVRLRTLPACHDEKRDPERFGEYKNFRQGGI
jgi:hypothetical protein